MSPIDMQLCFLSWFSSHLLTLKADPTLSTITWKLHLSLWHTDRPTSGHHVAGRLKVKQAPETLQRPSRTRKSHNSSLVALVLRALATRQLCLQISAQTEAPGPGDTARCLPANRNTTNTIEPTAPVPRGDQQHRLRGGDAHDSLAYLEKGSACSSHFHD